MSRFLSQSLTINTRSSARASFAPHASAISIDIQVDRGRGKADCSELYEAAGAIAQIIKPDEKLHSGLAVENEL
jgi:hypothetical protein